MKNRHRIPLVKIGVFGISYLRHQNPYMVAWWSAAFPGFGHYLLNQYLRGTLLTLTEKGINTLSHINQAMVYSFCGKFEMAKSIIHPQWLLGYIIVYCYVIWDSYRSTLVQNKMFNLAELENERFHPVVFNPAELQYLEKKNPLIAAFYSFFFPGLGQLYNHQFALAFYAMIWWWIYITLSRVHESVLNLIIGNN